ncbi:MAG TPA: zf-HC2 domain-containing protein [Minicystis sp.]|nr:zf-HC2 domain-containing protein [Minicystis sp.]
MIDCTLFTRAIDGYVDGELDPAHAIDMEAHVVACGACAERVALLRATRHSMKRVSASRASDALRARCSGALEREKKRAEMRRAVEEDLSPKLIRLRYALGLAAAAGVVFAMGMARYRHQREADAQLAAPASGDETSHAGFDTLIDDLVALHAHPLPPETTNPDELQQWDPLVGVPIRRPAFQPFGGHFRGARVLAHADRRAALLQYTVLGGHRVTVYVFDPRAVPVQATRLEPRLVRERPVYVGHVRGYSVAAAEQRGIGYALATDLDDEKSTDMVLAALQQ